MTNYINMFRSKKNPSQITCIIIHVVSSCATTNYPASLDSWSKYPGEHHGDHVPWSAGATFRHPRLSLSGGQCAGRGGDWWSVDNFGHPRTSNNQNDPHVFRMF